MQERYLHAAVAKLAPGVSIINRDNTYEGIIWPDGFVPPTKAALLAEIAVQSAPVDQADLDRWDRKLKALAIVTKPAGMTMAQFKTALKAAYDSLQ